MTPEPSKTLDLFVPGRVCLFGEHSDWAGGFRKENPDIPQGQCLISGTNQGIFARVSAHPSNLVLKSTLDNGKCESITLSLENDELMAEATCATSMWSYICGVALEMRKKYPNICGLVLDNYKTTLPVKKGLSSSAAICVLAARAFNKLYSLNLSTRDEMEFAYLGEILTPSKCGRMDQGCAFGSKPVLMKFDGDILNVEEKVEIGGPIYLIIVDLHASKSTPHILSDLRRAYPKASCDITRGVQKLLGEVNHDIMNEALQALQEGSGEKVGACMIRAQAEFDKFAIPASPDHLTSPVLHKVLNCKKLKPFVHGGKGVGSQGDGSAQFVAKTKNDQMKAIRLIEIEFGMTCLPLTLGDV